MWKSSIPTVSVSLPLPQDPLRRAVKKLNPQASLWTYWIWIPWKVSEVFAPKQALVEDNGFTMLCWFLLYTNVNQPWVYIRPLPVDRPSISHTTPHLWLVTEHWAEFPVLYTNFPLVAYFTYGNVYASMLCKQFFTVLVMWELLNLQPFRCKEHNKQTYLDDILISHFSIYNQKALLICPRLVS